MKKAILSLFAAFIMFALCGCSFGRRFWTTYKITGGEDTGVVYIDDGGGENPVSSKSRGENPQSSSETQESKNQSSAENHLPTQTGEESKKYSGYYYQKMDAAQRSAYENIEKAAKNLSTDFIKLKSVKSYRDLVLAHTGVRNDFPEYFWLDGNYSWKEHGGVYYIKLKYTCQASAKAEMENKLNAALLEFDRRISKYSAQYDRELEAFRWLADRVKYDYDAAEAEKSAHTADFRAFSAYGAIVTDRMSDGGKTAKAVCEGYSRAFNLLLSRAGIESTLVSGTFSGGRHMWNAVRIDGKWYNVDVTTCDTEDELGYFLFNVTDSAMKNAYKWDADFKLTEFASSTLVENFNFSVPPCVSNDNNYLAKCGRMINSGDAKTVAARINEAFSLGARRCEFVINDNDDYVFNAENAFQKLGIGGIEKELNPGINPGKITVSGIEGTKGFVISW